MTIIPFGDRAALINFEQRIDLEINAKVAALSHAIKEHKIEGVEYCIPAYCSITVVYQTELISFDSLCKKLKQIQAVLPAHIAIDTSRRINIPVCYHEEFAVDREEIMEQTQLPWEDIKAIHTGQEYNVFMLGFIAGFAYLGTLPASIKCSRKSNPRRHIPAGTVGIAGLQTGIYPKEAHAGWQLMGRTPIPVFEAQSENPFLFKTGDTVKLYEIDRDQYNSISIEIREGKFKLKSVITYGKDDA